jgi:hypothetical protein
VKANKKIVFAAAYIVVALVGYTLFAKYSLSKYEEERAILEAEYAAIFPSLKGFEPDYFFMSSVWGRNMITVGSVLGLSSPFVIQAIFRVVDKTERKGRG